LLQQICCNSAVDSSGHSDYYSGHVITALLFSHVIVSHLEGKSNKSVLYDFAYKSDSLSNAVLSLYLL
jgi:hypothetical protein